MNKHIHITKNGVKIPLNKMTDNHLINTIKMIRMRAKDGVMIGSCFSGIADTIDFDIIYGSEVKQLWDLKKYKKEAKRRGLL